MTNEQFLNLLKNVKKASNGWTALCPGHEDKNNSLCVSEGDDGRILLHCQAGCDVQDVLACLNLTFKDLYLDGNNTFKKEITTTYDYQAAGGKLVYQVVRFFPKDFRQRRPDGNGGWIWNMKGIEAVPYHLPELTEAIQAGQTVYIAEGEKDTDNLRALDLPATCNHGGAGKWRDCHSKHFLAGTQAVVIQDNDNPGRKHGQSVAGQLTNRGCRVKLFGVPIGKDVTDWLAAGGTKEALLELVNKAEYWQPKTEEEITRERREEMIMNEKILQAERKALGLDGVPIENEVELRRQKAEEEAVQVERIVQELPDCYSEWLSVIAKTGYLILPPGLLAYTKFSNKGLPFDVPLANFLARPTREIVKDDGLDIQRTFELEGILAGGIKLKKVTVGADRFSSMNWLTEAWGLQVNTEPGMGAKDRVRHAIQQMAGDIATETVFTHTGWRKIGGKWCFLHGGGAVGLDNVSVDLNEAKLTGYQLPTVNNSGYEALEATKNLISLFPAKIAYPALAIVFLAPLCEFYKQLSGQDIAEVLIPSLILFFLGKTGNYKTAVALVLQSFFGVFPEAAGSFKSTLNSLEKKAFLAKDVLLLIDDYYPAGNKYNREKMVAVFQGVVRLYADRAARERLKSDRMSAGSYQPRGLCLITGEDIPDLGESGLARLFTIDFKPGDIDKENLTQAQNNITLYRQAIRLYIEYLLTKTEVLPEKLKEMFYEYREILTSKLPGIHDRIISNASWLLSGFTVFVKFLMDNKGITRIEAEELKGNAIGVFAELAMASDYRIKTEKPVAMFLNALNELVVSGKVYLASAFEPLIADKTSSVIGWKDEQWLYLLPEITYKEITQFYSQQGRSFPIGLRTLLKHLEEEDLIEIEMDSKQVYRTIRLSHVERRPRVLKLKASVFYEKS